LRDQHQELRTVQSHLPIAFYHINQVISGSIRFPNSNVGITDLVLAKHGLDFVMVDVRQWDGVSDSNPTLIFLPHQDGRRLLVKSYTKTFKFAFDDRFVPKGFENIEDYKDQITRSGHWKRALLMSTNMGWRGDNTSDNLSTTTFAVVCTFNDTS
jgi:hypothetical protein